jgi:DNA sulfur modification protein DndB
LTLSKTDLTTGQFATLSAIKGEQFGRDVYSSVIKFKDLKEFLEVFPNVQRGIIKKKVNSIRRYILTGLENKEELRFFSAVTVTCKGTMYYDQNRFRIAVDTDDSKLSINDGQHRFEGAKSAIEYLEKEFVKSKDKDRTMEISEQIEYLKEMIIPVVIFDGLSESEEKQLFSDLNNLSQRPSRNANIRLNQKDLYSKMARELSEENRYLKHIGVEQDKMSIHSSNENTILLSTIYKMIKELLGAELKYDKKFLNKRNYSRYKKKINETFDKLFFSLPPDIDIKRKYLFEKSFTFKAICRFITHARNHLELQLSDDEIFEIIGSIDFSYNIDFWKHYGGIQGTQKNIVFGGGGGGGFTAVYDALYAKAIATKEKDAVTK